MESQRSWTKQHVEHHALRWNTRNCRPFFSGFGCGIRGSKLQKLLYTHGVRLQLATSLKGIDLSGMPVLNMNFTNAFLGNANMRNANLTGTNFNNAYLGKADLRRNSTITLRAICKRFSGSQFL